MPKYSELFSDEKIVSLIDPSYKNILLLACSGCMNESLAFKYSLPIISYGDKETYPAVESECLRLTAFLVNKGFSVDTLYIPSGVKCIRNLDEEQLSMPNTLNPDVALVLACPDGLWGLSKQINDIPLIRISKWMGTIFYRYHDDGIERKIERGKVSAFTTAT